MKGDRTRQSILEHAVDISSVEGLEGLTIGRLADDLGMSKSGLFAHFGSKEDLQLAVIDAAGERFIAETFRPALKAERGYPRLLAIEKAIVMARDEGHLHAEVDPKQLAFEINSLFFGANFSYQLRNDKKALQRATRAIEDRLESLRAFPWSQAGKVSAAADRTS